MTTALREWFKKPSRNVFSRTVTFNMHASYQEMVCQWVTCCHGHGASRSPASGRTNVIRASSCTHRRSRCGCSVLPRRQRPVETRHPSIRRCRNGSKKCEWHSHTPETGTNPHHRGAARCATVYRHCPTHGPSGGGNRNRVRG